MHKNRSTTSAGRLPLYIRLLVVPFLLSAAFGSQVTQGRVSASPQLSPTMPMRPFQSYAAGAATSASTASAVFLANDTTTQGNWMQAYGAEGYGLINNAVSYPAYAQVAVSGASPYTWAASTHRRPRPATPGASDRVAACWYTGSSFTIDVNLTDGARHQVALYALDWDGVARTERIDVLDAVERRRARHPHPERFPGGQYLVWTLSGHLTLRVTNTSSMNAVVSGLFFDGATLAIPTRPSFVRTT